MSATDTFTQAGPAAVRHYEPYASAFGATKGRRRTGTALVRTSRKPMTDVFYVLTALQDQEQ